MNQKDKLINSIQSSLEITARNELRKTAISNIQKRQYYYGPGTYIPGTWNDNVGTDENGNSYGAYVVKDGKAIAGSNIDTDGHIIKNVIETNVLSNDGDLRITAKDDLYLEGKKIRFNTEHISSDVDPYGLSSLILNGEPLFDVLDAFKVFTVQGVINSDNLEEIRQSATQNNIGDIYCVQIISSDTLSSNTVDINTGDDVRDKYLDTVANGDIIILFSVKDAVNTIADKKSKSESFLKRLFRKHKRNAEDSSSYIWYKLDATIDLSMYALEKDLLALSAEIKDDLSSMNDNISATYETKDHVKNNYLRISSSCISSNVEAGIYQGGFYVPCGYDETNNMMFVRILTTIKHTGDDQNNNPIYSAGLTIDNSIYNLSSIEIIENN